VGSSCSRRREIDGTGLVMKHVLLLDTETTGLSPKQGSQLVEVACMLYDVQYASPVSSFASIVRVQSNAAEHVNHIRPEMLKIAPPIQRVWPIVREMAAGVDAICAHRAEFDMQFMPEDIRNSAPWICTKVDVDWPGDKIGEDLVHLALSYGIGIVTAHRAMADVDMMSRIFTRVAENNSLEDLLLRALRPKKKFVAIVTIHQKDMAKRRGFLWDEDKREWYRFMPPEDVDKLPFKVRAA